MSFPRLAVALVVLVLATCPALAQNNQQVSGIQIDPDGVVSPVFTKSAALDKKRFAAAAAANLAADLNAPSPLRKVSLPRLEGAYRQFAADPQRTPDEMKYLAGLQRIDHVFMYPDTNDLVIAGPAAGFAPDSTGRVLCVDTGRPPMRLEDLIVALRITDRGRDLGCSIDPMPQNLAAMIQHVNANSDATTFEEGQARFRERTQILGMQNVRVWGVPPDSHFSLALVEADYRMKLVSLELERTGVLGFRSHLSMLTPTGNTMQRWWFTPLYDALSQNEDGTAFQFSGQRAQLLSQEEISNAAGRRSDAAFTRRTTEKYAQHFTEKFPELAAAMPVFAELQSLIDLAVLGALVRKDDLAGRADWSMSLFLDAEKAPLEKTNVPRRVASVVNTRHVNRGMIIGLIAGGIVIDPQSTVARHVADADASQRLAGLRNLAARQDASAEHPWWWD